MPIDPSNTYGGRRLAPSPITRRSSEIINLNSTSQTADQQMQALLASQGIPSFINPNTNVFTTGTPEELESSQHPEEMGAGSAQMEAAIAASKPPEEAKPEEKPKEKPTPHKKKPKLVLSNQQMNPAELIADLMAQMGFNPEEMEQTGRSRYNAAEASTPTLGIRGTPGDQWMGLLSALLEEKKRKEETTSMRSLGNGRY
jgi:hypothetical protein